jgi:hypothetical protein
MTPLDQSQMKIIEETKENQTYDNYLNACRPLPSNPLSELHRNIIKDRARRSSSGNEIQKRGLEKLE